MRHGDTRREQVRRGRGLDGGTAELIGELDAQIRPVVAEMDAQIRPVLDEFEPLPTDGEVRAFLRGLRAGKASALEAGGKGAGRGC